MKRNVLRLTESDIVRLVAESVKILTEENKAVGGGSGEASEGVEFEIPLNNESEIAHFKSKLLWLKRKAVSAGGDVNFTVKTVKAPVKVRQKDESGIPREVIVMEDFAHFTIIPSTPVIQMEGYKYIGSIVPLAINVDGEFKESMIVSLSKEFEGNDELRNELKNSSMKMTCDGCHRETSRGIYYCFLEEKTGRVLKLGSKCASKYFGIDVGNKIQSLFSALSSLGEEPYVIYDPDGFPVDKIRYPRMDTIESQMCDSEALEFQNMIMRGCMAIAEYGPYCNMKTSMTHAQTLEDLLGRARNDSYVRRGGDYKFDSHLYKVKVDRLKEQYPELFQLREKATQLSNEFFSEGAKYFYYMDPATEFDEKIKNIGLLICGGLIQKKQIGKFSYMNFIPYCVSRFFKDKADKDPANAENVVKPITPFDGVKQFNVKVTNIDKKQMRNGGDYYKVMATTSDNESVSWNIFRGEPTFKVGDKITIEGSYNQRFKSLDNVRVQQAQDANTNGGQAVEVTYPADGTRYRNANFVITKLTNTYLRVKNTADNCEYYINNVSEGYGYYGVTKEKFDLGGLNEGDNVTLTGTVASYVSQRTGQKGYKLLRVSGLPASGRVISYNSDYF